MGEQDPDAAGRMSSIDKFAILNYNPHMSDQHDPYTASTLARAAGVSTSYVARLCRLGTLPCRRLNSVWLIRFEDGATWLKGRQKPTER